MSRSNPYKRKPRTARHTTLIVVEGETDEIFVKHLRGHFGKDSGSRVTVKPARGNADKVLKVAIQSFEDFDLRVALYDEDSPPRPALLKIARTRKIRILVCSPCLEGLLLSLLGEKPPTAAVDCKRRLEQHVPTSLTDPQTYQRHFPPPLLTSRADELDLLRELLSLFTTSPQ